MTTKEFTKEPQNKIAVFMSAKSDIIFKLLFGNELNKDLLIKFLMAVLNIPLDEYAEIKITDPQAKRKYKGDKLAILDVKVTTATGMIINIEIQVDITNSIRERIVFYNAKMMADQLGSGDDYQSIKKTISIVVTGSDLLPEHSKYHDKFTLYSQNTNTEFTDIVEIHTLELSKLPKESDGTDLWDWLEFINADSEEALAVLAQKSPQMKKPVDKLLQLNQDSDARAMYEGLEKQRRDAAARMHTAVLKGRQEGLAEGLAEGLTKGERNKAFDVARNLLKMNFSIENIASITGLTAKEIKSL